MSQCLSPVRLDFGIKTRKRRKAFPQVPSMIERKLMQLMNVCQQTIVSAEIRLKSVKTQTDSV